MLNELSKRERKIARILIDRGINADLKIAIEEAKAIIAAWELGGMDNSTAFDKLYKKIRKQHKFIARRYDYLSGSDYLTTLAQIYVDGHITEEDLKDFSEDNSAYLNRVLQRSKEEE